MRCVVHRGLVYKRQVHNRFVKKTGAFRFSAGLSLVEVLVSLTLISLSATSLSVLHLHTAQATQSTQWRFQAGLLAQEALTYIRLNQVGRSVYLNAAVWDSLAVDPALAEVPDAHGCLGVLCAGDLMATRDIAYLQRLAAYQLPYGRMSVARCPLTLETCVRVRWSGLSADAACDDAKTECAWLSLGRSV